MFFGLALSLSRTKVPMKIFVRHLIRLEDIMKSLKITLSLSMFL